LVWNAKRRFQNNALRSRSASAAPKKRPAVCDALLCSDVGGDPQLLAKPIPRLPEVAALHIYPAQVVMGNAFKKPVVNLTATDDDFLEPSAGSGEVAAKEGEEPEERLWHVLPEWVADLLHQGVGLPCVADGTDVVGNALRQPSRSQREEHQGLTEPVALTPKRLGRPR
jgi:hypothetical protein